MVCGVVPTVTKRLRRAIVAVFSSARRGLLPSLAWAVSAAGGTAHLRTPTVIPVRDGRALAADFYLPAESGSWPAILIQTPYNKDALAPVFESAYLSDPLLESPDYAFVVVDWRGTFGSADARYADSPTMGEDGYDCVEWAAVQPW